MIHDPSKIALGITRSTDKSVISDYEETPSNFPAGTAVRKSADGSLSTDASDGEFYGVSMGKSLSQHPRLAVCRMGEGVPIKLSEVPSVAASKTIQDIIYTAVNSGFDGNRIKIQYVNDLPGGD